MSRKSRTCSKTAAGSSADGANIRRAHSIIVRKIEEATDPVEEMHDGFAALIEKIEQRLGI